MTTAQLAILHICHQTSSFYDHHNIFVAFWRCFHLTEVWQLQLHCRCWICEAVVGLFVWKNRVFKMYTEFCYHLCCSSSVILDTIPFNVQRSLALSLGFRSLFLLADAITTVDIAALDKHNRVAVLVTDAPAKRTPTICPLRKSDKCPILQCFRTICY